jgi:hypothetical protein
MTLFSLVLLAFTLRLNVPNALYCFTFLHLYSSQSCQWTFYPLFSAFSYRSGYDPIKYSRKPIMATITWIRTIFIPLNKGPRSGVC